MKSRCFCCEKKLTDAGYDTDTYWCTNVSEGGWAELHFGFGSRFDNIECDGSLKGTNRMIIYICDNCFQDKFKLVECWRVKQPTPHGERIKVRSPKSRGEMRNPLNPLDWL